MTEKKKVPPTNEIADSICKVDHFAQDAGQKLYRYTDGVYVPGGGEYIKSEVKNLLLRSEVGEEWSAHRASEVVEFIRVDSPKLWERAPVDTVNVANGLLNVESRELRPHSPEHLSPVQLPVSFDSKATCPRTETFIKQVFPPDSIALAYEVVGWLMVPDVSIQKAILLTGEGANGKSTWLAQVTAFLGRGNVSGVSLHDLERNRFAPVKLMGRLANICPDLPSQHLDGTSVFKAVVGGDMMSGEHKYGDLFEFTPFARLVFSANHPPRSSDSSEAFFRRWLVVPFERTFSGSKAIPRDTLDRNLAAPDELSGLLNKVPQKN